MELADLDKEQLAQRLLMLPLATLKSRNKWPKGALEDNINATEDDPEGLFVKDLFTLSNSEILDKWYGGEEEAHRILFNLQHPD